ncbi:hypothetical protein SAMN05216205_1197 [Pseudomonas mohnii]|uniref:Uncharacterized protein n=1 Tax=Pseudomonas mohnii TaxID=395600 RepID=A0ABY0XRR8_9PSED|nr:hypothetical protein [Pseudomonas mohnii]SEB99913.1 hypothetical protein SAMN05216205_1197 [Pseudomonas mohnii]
MEFYDEMAQMTLDMMAEFGRPLTLRRTIAGKYDTSIGKNRPGVVEEQVITTIVRPASQGTVQAFDQKFQEGTLIESNIRALKIAAKGMLWPPAPGHVVILDGEEWKVIGVTPVSPAGIDLLYSASVMR